MPSAGAFSDIGDLGVIDLYLVVNLIGAKGGMGTGKQWEDHRRDARDESSRSVSDHSWIPE